MIRLTNALQTLACAALACGACAGPRAVAPHDPFAGTTPAELERRGLALARAGDDVRAEQYLVTAIERGLPEERAIGPLLQVCVGASRYGAALHHARHFRDHHPDAWQPGLVVVALEGAIGDADQARADLEQLVARWPAEPEPRFALAEAYADDGDRRLAAREYGRYLELAPGGAHASTARARRRQLRRVRATRRSR